jgi:ribonuclease P protein component
MGNGARVTARSLILYVDDGSGLEAGPARLGIIASRKVGNAVQRNRAKRLIRDAFRRLHSGLREPLDLVVIATRRTLQLTGNEVREELETALRRRRLLG